MTIAKKRRTRCQYHYATGRSWDEYYLSYTDKWDTEIYHCIKCKKGDEEKSIAFSKMYDNQRIQRKEKSDKYWIKYDEKIRLKSIRIKEELWDCYVWDELSKGVKNKWIIRFPKELIQLKRALIKLERAILKRKEYLNDIKNEEIKRIEKLKEPLVECGKHGDLFLDDVIKSGKSRWTGEQHYKCRRCMSDFHKNHYRRKKCQK